MLFDLLATAFHLADTIGFGIPGDILDAAAEAERNANRRKEDHIGYLARMEAKREFERLEKENRDRNDIG